MTDEQKVFIFGVDGRGDEVIKMLTDLGGKNCDDLNGENSNVVYFITHIGIIGYTSLESEVACMISEYCHEVKLPERWRDGNILVMKNNPNQFAVYNDDLVGGDFFESYMQIGPRTVFSHERLKRADYKLGDDEDVLTFHRSLQVMGKRWNAMNKTVEDGRDALPDNDTLYFYITSVGDVQSAVVKNSIDRTRFRIGNFFHTREEANGMAEKVKNLLKGGHE